MYIDEPRNKIWTTVNQKNATTCFAHVKSSIFTSVGGFLVCPFRRVLLFTLYVRRFLCTLRNTTLSKTLYVVFDISTSKTFLTSIVVLVTFRSKQYMIVGRVKVNSGTHKIPELNLWIIPQDYFEQFWIISNRT